MAKTLSSTKSSDGFVSESRTVSNRLGSRTSTKSSRLVRKGKVTELVTTNSVSSTSNSGSVFIVLKIVLIMMLTLSLFSLLFGHQTFFGFQTLLNALAEVPAGDLTAVTDVLQIPTINSNWGVVDGLRTFINNFINITNSSISFVCYIGYGFYQLVTLVGYFIGLI